MRAAGLDAVQPAKAKRAREGGPSLRMRRCVSVHCGICGLHQPPLLLVPFASSQKCDSCPRPLSRLPNFPTRKSIYRPLAQSHGVPCRFMRPFAANQLHSSPDHCLQNHRFAWRTPTTTAATTTVRAMTPTIRPLRATQTPTRPKP